MKIIKKFFYYLKLIIISLYLSFSFFVHFGLMIFISGIYDEIKLGNGNKTIQEIFKINFNKITINEIFEKILKIMNQFSLYIIVFAIIIISLFLILKFVNKKELEEIYDKKNI